jgi:hypothetical protein
MKKIQILGWSENADYAFRKSREHLKLKFPFELSMDNYIGGDFVIYNQYGDEILHDFRFNYKILEENYNVPPKFPTELYLLVLADDDFYDHTIYTNMGIFLAKEEAETKGHEMLDPDYKERMIVQKWIWDGTKYKIENDEKI